jgi:hypothetical protein
MTITYALKRSDIWDTYWFTWRNGWKLRGAQLVIAGCAFVVAISWLTEGRPASTSQILEALGIALLSILWLPVYPLLRYKPQQRMLTIGPQGIVTSIGDRSGEIPWAAIDRVQVDGNRLYVVGKSGNAFAIPSTAFSSNEERDEFLAQATLFWKGQAAA